MLDLEPPSPLARQPAEVIEAMSFGAIVGQYG
jgi:hypothetical protein